MRKKYFTDEEKKEANRAYWRKYQRKLRATPEGRAYLNEIHKKYRDSKKEQE